MRPNMILVDLHESIPYAKEQFEKMREAEYDDEEIMEMLIAFLDDRDLGEYGLECYAERIMEDHRLIGKASDGEHMVQGMLALGNQLFDTLKRADVYDQHGSLGIMHFEGWRNSTTAIFVRDMADQQ